MGLLWREEAKNYFSNMAILVIANLSYSFYQGMYTLLIVLVDP